MKEKNSQVLHWEVTENHHHCINASCEVQWNYVEAPGQEEDVTKSERETGHTLKTSASVKRSQTTQDKGRIDEVSEEVSAAGRQMLTSFYTQLSCDLPSDRFWTLCAGNPTDTKSLCCCSNICCVSLFHPLHFELVQESCCWKNTTFPVRLLHNKSF